MPERRVCPKRGWIWLTTSSNRTVVMETTCKTWGCAACAKKLKALFSMRVEAGISALGRCAFTTFTLRREDEALGADYVRVAWKEFSRRWNRTEEGFQWLKVVELTKRRQPHLHLVMGPVEGHLRCYGPRRKIGDWFRRDRDCACLSHRLSRIWEQVTGDSWVVYLVEVSGGGGAAGYLSKYMAKTHEQRALLWEAGFSRRWSTSKGWPGGGRIRLRQTERGGWKARDMHSFGTTKPNPPDLEVRVGPAWALEWKNRRKDLALAGRAERLINAKDKSAEIRAADNKRRD